LIKTLYNTRIKQLINEYFMNYLTVYVLRDDSDHDCTANGVTSIKNKGRYTFFVPCEDGNYTLDDINNHSGEAVILVPGEKGGAINFSPEGTENVWTMFGGNFVYSGDSRFGRAYGRQPVHVHDRIEG